MNDDKTKPRVKVEAPAPAAKNAPSNGVAVAPMPAKIELELALLSYSFARDLTRIPREEWSKIESVPCRVGFTRDMAEGIRFVDAVANVVNQHGGLFATQNMDKRRDLEKCSEEIVDAFRTIILTTVDVARKLRLTNILERYWRLLSVYGPAPKKADRGKAAPKPVAAKQESAAAEVA
jgi:hypothetical protein